MSKTKERLIRFAERQRALRAPGFGALLTFALAKALAESEPLIQTGRYTGQLAHRWRELQGLGGGWTCDACRKRASECYGDERFVCSGVGGPS